MNEHDRFTFLVKRLRNCSTYAAPCKTCDLKGNVYCTDTLMAQATTAMEELIAIANSYKRSMETWAKEAANAANASSWISVEERLPDYDGRYIVASQFLGMPKEPLIVGTADYAGNLEVIDQYDFEGINRPGWYSYDSEYGFYERHGVRYWMILPKPPKEGLDEPKSHPAAQP